MTPTAPARSTRHPARLAHLGLGAFHRAHQAWYTQAANDAGGDWGIVAFTGRSPRAAELLTAQDDVYALIERGVDGDRARLIESISAAVDGADGPRWRATLADPAVVVLTVTVTEAGYLAAADGANLAHPGLRADLAWLGAGDRDAAARTAPARIVDGLRARRAAQAGPIAIVSCDNLPDNGAVLRRVVLDVARRVDPGLADWIAHEASFVSTMVDRITPAATTADERIAEHLTGLHDRAPVVTEPFSEWVLSGDFPAGRPSWEAGGARFVPDIEPFERRKLWLLNAGHSLLAYLGLLRGHATIAQAFADEACRDAVETLWAEAREVLPLGPDELDAAIDSLRERFSNARIEHRLSQVASDGRHKLPARVGDVIRARRDAGLPIGAGAPRTIAAWALHLAEPDRADASAEELAADLARLDDAEDRARAVLTALAPDLADDGEVVSAVSAELIRLTADRIPGRIRL